MKKVHLLDKDGFLLCGALADPMVLHVTTDPALVNCSTCIATIEGGT